MDGQFCPLVPELLVDQAREMLWGLFALECLVR